MSGQFYDGGKLSRTYLFPSADIASAAIFGRIQGPAGKVGRVRGIEYHLVAATTGAAAEITAGNTSAVLPAACSVPVALINTGGAMTAAELAAAGAPAVAGVNDVELAADSIVEFASDGGCTLGTADVAITIDWF